MKLCSINIFPAAASGAASSRKAALPFLMMAAVLCALILPADHAAAQTRLPALFSDGMVLQRSSDAPVWGWDIPGTEISVTASWDGRSCTATAGEDGRWMTRIETPEAGGPYEITVRGSEEKVIRGVLSGEVWICSGQSNMAMPVRGYTSQPVEDSFRTILSAPEYGERIHVFNVTKDPGPEVREDCRGLWKEASCESAATTSAVAWHFAVALTEALGVPVGIIVSAYGSTKIEPWTPKDALEDALEGAIPKKLLEEKLSARNVEGKAPTEAGSLYNSMIAPLSPYAAKGFLWYQGCSSRKDYGHYALMQTAMVEAWRRAWGDDNAEMPFIFATIAPHAYGNAEDAVRAYFVESQLKSLEMIPNSHAVVTEGLGEKDCIHPPKKREVGEMMAWTALSKTYGVSGMTAGYPQYDRMETGEGVVTVWFSNAKYGLCPSYGEPLKGFYLAGKDRTFHEATAVILKNPLRVEVRCEAVPEPVAVRYSFFNWCESNLTDTFGIPVPPFRSDDWPNNKE